MKWVIFSYVIAITGLLYLYFSDWAYDDPFITYRYAQNLSQGEGFVYNPGERVLSTTTPLFTLVLAVGGLIWPDLHHLSLLIGAASLGIGSLLLFDLAQSMESPWVGWTGLLLYPTFPLMVSTLGSELPLYLALCLGAFALYARKSYLPTGICAGLAFLARPDGILVPVLLALDYIFHLSHAKKTNPPTPLPAIITFGGIVSIWIGFSLFYFGSPVPVTLAAKQQQGSLAISEKFAPGFLTILRGYDSWPYYLFAGLVVFGVVYAFWNGRAWIYFLAWPVVFFGAYATLGVSRYFWYYAPLVPGAIVAVGLGLEAIQNWLTPLADKLSRGSKVLPVFIMLALFLANGNYLRTMPEKRDPRYPIYREAGEWMRENTDKPDSVGALEVGIIGYYAERSMVDFAGLIQPEVAESLQREDTYEDAARFAIGRFHPDYLILHQGLFSTLEREIASKGCVIERVLSGEDFGYPWNLQIYDCRKYDTID